MSSTAEWSPRRRRARPVVTAVLVLTTVLLAVFAAWALRPAATDPRDDADAIHSSLLYLRERLDGGSAEQAQQLFSESYFFSYPLYGLAWSDRGCRPRPRPLGGALGARPARFARRTQVFTEDQSPAYGIFYAGWTLLVRAHVERLGSGGTAELDRLRRDADEVPDAFAANLHAGRSPFLTADPGRSWPVDSVVAVAALRRADAVTGDDHGALVDPRHYAARRSRCAGVPEGCRRQRRRGLWAASSNAMAADPAASLAGPGRGLGVAVAPPPDARRLSGPMCGPGDERGADHAVPRSSP